MDCSSREWTYWLYALSSDLGSVASLVPVAQSWVLHVRYSFSCGRARARAIRYFFRNPEDFARIFGFSALQLPPTSKEQHRFAEISIYPLGDSELAELRASDEFGAKARRGPPFDSAHWVEFEPARETLTLCVGAAIFSGSVGAAIFSGIKLY